jgi:hypothetical protein
VPLDWATRHVLEDARQLLAARQALDDVVAGRLLNIPRIERLMRFLADLAAGIVQTSVPAGTIPEPKPDADQLQAGIEAMLRPRRARTSLSAGAVKEAA